MKTAYLGEGPSRRGSPVKFLLAAMAMAMLPLGAAVAQQPATPPDATAPAVEAPPVIEEAPALAPETAAPAAADAAEGEDQAMSEAFSLSGIWEQGDFVARGTLIIMVLMFAGTIYIAATKFVDQTILLGQSKKIPAFWDANTLDEGLDVLGRNSAFRTIAEGAIAQANSAQAGLGARIGRSDRMSHQVGIELERVNSRLQAGMAFLATVGAICPFVGLFGTVWGIVNALIRIGTSGDPSIEKVAGPVGEALIMTAVGLAVAVPAVVLYNLLGRRNKNISDAARHFAFDVDKLMASSAKA
ncbi:MAG TPA: MotA/TolQ/ExbB proton channel family protein [Hyphomonadaceae bacterium]|nr:MotA/TolQ/ExbB proton channel family protein [Hyphomonadaceae bacterium]